MPKTQSALLEAMAERQVTVDGDDARAAGAVPAARDREPDRARGHVPAARGPARPLLPEDRARLPARRRRAADPRATSATATRSAACSRSSRSTRSRRCRTPSRDVYVDELLQRWIVDLVRATRELDAVAIGASVRGSLALERAVRAWALLHGRDYVVPDDVERPVPAGARPPHRLHAGVPRRGAASSAGRGRSDELQAPLPRAARRGPRPSRPPSVLADHAAAVDAHRRGHVPARPAPAADRARVRRDAQRPPRPRLRRRRLAAVPPGRRRARDRLGRARRGSPRRAARDEFVVRERFAEEAPRVVVVCDRRPAMALFPPGLPWLSKPEAMRVAAVADRRRDAAGARARRLPRLRRPASDEPFWRPPNAQHEHWRLKESHLTYPALRRAGRHASRARSRFLGELRRTLPTGSFVFVLSDFLEPPTRRAWAQALELPLGPRPGRDPGPGLGAELPGGRRRRRPVRRPGDGRVRPRSAQRRREVMRGGARTRSASPGCSPTSSASTSSRSCSPRPSPTRCSARSSAGPPSASRCRCSHERVPQASDRGRAARRRRRWRLCLVIVAVRLGWFRPAPSLPDEAACGRDRHDLAPLALLRRHRHRASWSCSSGATASRPRP